MKFSGGRWSGRSIKHPRHILDDGDFVFFLFFVVMSTPAELKLQPPSAMTDEEENELFFKILAEIEEDKKRSDTKLTQKEKEAIDSKMDKWFAPFFKSMEDSEKVVDGLANVLQK